MTGGVIPHMRIVVAASVAAIGGYAAFSAWVVLVSDDAALRGDTIGTWKSFAVLAFGFWLGSSSGGKAKEPDPPPKDAVDAAHQTADAATRKADQIEGRTT